jgi:hypothetical protein
MKKFLGTLLSIITFFIMLYLFGLLFDYIGLHQIADILYFMPNTVMGWVHRFLG